PRTPNASAAPERNVTPSRQIMGTSLPGVPPTSLSWCRDPDRDSASCTEADVPVNLRSEVAATSYSSERPLVVHVEEIEPAVPQAEADRLTGLGPDEALGLDDEAR